MKNYTTPRTLDESQISAFFDPIEYYARPYSRSWWTAVYVIAVAAIILVWWLR